MGGKLLGRGEEWTSAGGEIGKKIKSNVAQHSIKTQKETSVGKRQKVGVNIKLHS